MDAYRELTLCSWDDPVPGAVRVRFATPALAEAWLRRFAGDPWAEAALRAVLDVDPSRAFDDPDALLRIAAEGLCVKRLYVYERSLAERFTDAPVGPKEPDGPDEPVDPDEPVEPSNAKPAPAVAPPARWELEAAVEGEVGDDCFEDSALRLRARLRDGAAKVSTATFTVLRDGARVADGSVSTSGDVTFAWQLALVAEAEASWTLEFRFTYDGDVYTGNRAFTVWPRSVRLRALHARTGQPVKGFRFTVAQGGAAQPADTGDDGAVEHALAKPAPFEVSSEAPFVVREWTRATGRAREAKVERKYKAAFHNPAKPTPDKAIEQRVNLATKDRGRDGLGSKVSVRVGAAGDAARAAGDRVGVQGDELFVKVLFTRASKRNSPLPAASGLRDAKVVGALTTGKVTLGAQGEAAVIELELGVAGGDQCAVSVGVTPEANDETLTFTNWRALFYQATRPSTMSLPSLARITACLEEVHVRYDKYKELAFTEADGPPAGAWFDGPMMGLPAGRCVCIGDHNKAHFHSKFDDAKNPVGVHVLLCHTQFDGGATAHKSTPADTLSKTTHVKVPFPPGSATTAWCHELDITTVNGQANVFPKAIQDGADAVRSATWTSLAAAGPHAGKSGAVPADHVHIDWVSNTNVVTIKMPADAAAAIDAGARVRLNYTVLWALGEFLGESDGPRPNLQLIAQLANDSTNDVMAHELGHTIGAVLKAPAPGLAAGDHGWKYTGRGHQGPHCAFGADAAVFSDATKNLTGLSAKCKCIMYGENSKVASGSNGRFCEKCRPFLDAQAVDDITK